MMRGNLHQGNFSMSNTVSIGNQQTTIYNSLMPKEGPKSVNLALDFTEQTEITVDFTLATMQTVISVVQSLWCDNSQSANEIDFTVENTGQVIRVPAGSMATLPVIAASKPKILVTSASGLIIPVLFLNVPLPSGVWSLSNTAGGPILAEVINTPLPVIVENFNNPQQVSGLVTTQTLEGRPSAATSTVIAAGGAAQTLFAANAITNTGIVQNPLSATEPLYIDGVGAANVTGTGTTFAIQPGQSFTCYPSSNAWTVNAATTGHAFAAEAM
jgi:hypothetical protein